jgi:hypothetical protein
MTKETESKTSESKELVNYEELLGNMAKAATTLERPSGSSIGTRGGILSYNGTPCPNNKLDVIVVASVFSNTLYEGKFDPNNLSSPVCFAYGVQEPGETAEQVESKMAPHPASTKPQSPTCSACPNNKWGSDPDGGRGKACKNGRSLAIIPAGTPAADIAGAELAILRPPVTSIKNWQMYVQKCSTLYNRPPLAIITQVGSVPDQKTQYKLTFTDIGVVDSSMFKGLIDKIPAALDVCQKVYEAGDNNAPAADNGKAKKF